MNSCGKLIKGEDFELSATGQVVMTKQYLLNRGHCCQSGCTNCPYEFQQNKVDPNTPQELQDPWSSSSDGQMELGFYVDD